MNSAHTTITNQPSHPAHPFASSSSSATPLPANPPPSIPFSAPTSFNPSTVPAVAIAWILSQLPPVLTVTIYAIRGIGDRMLRITNLWRFDQYHLSALLHGRLIFEELTSEEGLMAFWKHATEELCGITCIVDIVLSLIKVERLSGNPTPERVRGLWISHVVWSKLSMGRTLYHRGLKQKTTGAVEVLPLAANAILLGHLAPLYRFARSNLASIVSYTPNPAVLTSGAIVRVMYSEVRDQDGDVFVNIGSSPGANGGANHKDGDPVPHMDRLKSIVKHWQQQTPHSFHFIRLNPHLIRKPDSND